MVSEDSKVKLEKKWTEIKEENNYTSGVEKLPKRIEHTIINNVSGKPCKTWKPLVKFNKSKSHWDLLRNDCVDCLKKYRKEKK